MFKPGTIEDETEWPLMPLPSIPPDRLGETPFVPQMPPLPKPAEQMRFIDEDVQWMYEYRLLWLVENHPHPIVNGKIHDHMRDKTIGLDIALPSDGETASLMVFPDFTVTLTDGTREHYDYYPVFHFPAKNLVQIESDEDILIAWLVIFHELIHYRQFLLPPWENVPEFLVPKLLEPGGETIAFTAEECMFKWELEGEAYKEMCDLALDWGLPEIFPGDLCVAYLDDRTFAQYFFYHMLNTEGEQHPECVRMWGTRAGYPHPEWLVGYEGK